ncbi:MAG: alpha-amylase family glycosyl hydrolase [Dehalococcoidia bacterium]|nr:alpha-amylase family glycosyl hydrolase [Dehalococcoidia bacterium]
MDSRDRRLWWQWGTIYQVYPRSFMDSSGDGVGDLNGITSRLDYLQWLGVNAVWISPIFPSPMKDFGYDVADYCDIDPLFGTLAEFDTLLAEAHRRGLKVLLDFVPNHTSDQHPWFTESRAAKDSPKRDWYIWKDARPDGGPPNNWLANFGGIAWTWDETTQQYYYHAFLAEQPDLNWRHPQVQAAMMDALRFWLDRGVDGFRVDVMYHLIKDAQFRDNPPNPDYREGGHPYSALLPVYSCDQPEVHDIVALMRRTLDEYEDRLLVGEIYLPIERLVLYYGSAGDGCHLPFNFQLLLKPWNARIIAAVIDQYEAALPAGGWPNWVLGNHDRPRFASKAGAAQARVGAMLLLTLRGTPTIYQGEEIGMENVPVPPEMIQDPPGKTLGYGRDPFRTPMQWDGAPNAGFTAGNPWLPLAGNYRAVNVAAQTDDPASMLSLYRDLLALRQSQPALMAGAYRPVPAEGDILAYVRELDGARFLVVLNFGRQERRFALEPSLRGNIILSTHLDREGEATGDAVELRADEGVVVRLR